MFWPATWPSVGFVVSQDGTIRALARDGERLIMWETLELS